jgi:hypothetical protein
MVTHCPSFVPKLNESVHNRSSHTHTTLQPDLPADIATRQKCLSPINDNKLRVHHTERPEEQGLHHEIQPFQRTGMRQAQLLVPFCQLIDVTPLRGSV